jgi:hypothetical protein
MPVDEEGRRRCEAKYVLSMPKLEQRRDYLRRIEKARGIEGREYLEAEIRKVWKDKNT